MDLGIGGLGPATEIGAGASAIVYRARQLDLDREVAVKVLSVTDEAFVRRFAREAKTLGKLSQNPGIVTVYDTGVTAAGQPYLILELCRSSVLDRLQGADGAFDPTIACRAAAQVADAASDAHTNGVIHRDIKPGNVLVSQTGRYMVTDFGISTVTGATMGQTDSVGFTAGYVAPETLSGEVAGTPSDVYAIGATLFHMIAGRAPFVATGNSNLLALAQRVINDPVPDLRPQGIPDEVCRIIEWAMAKLPEDRPTAAQLRDQLQAVAHDLAEGAETGHGSTLAHSAVSPASAAIAGPAVSLAENRNGFGSGELDLAKAAALTIGADARLVDGLLTIDPPPEATPDGRSGLDPAPPIDDSHRTVISEPGPGPGIAPPTTGGHRPDGGILDHEPSVVGSGNGPALGDRRYAYTADDRRSQGPLIIGAIIGLLAMALVGVAGYLVSRNGDDDQGGGRLIVEAVDGPATSLSTKGNEATGQGPGGGRGTLDPTIGDRQGSDDAPGGRYPVVVSNVAGLGAAAAQTQLKALGFVVNTADEKSSTVAAGVVIRQSPAAGSSIARGSTVTIYVARNNATDTVLLPTLTGKTQAEAEIALAALDVTVAATTTRVSHPTVAVDRVVDTTPPAGSAVNVGSVVGLVLSDGPGARCSQMAGLTEAQATARLEDAGLTVSSTRQFSSSVASGHVISCRESESNATLVISSGSEVCTQVIGLNRTGAKAILETAGYSVAETGTPSNGGPIGEVLDCQTTGKSAAITYISAALPGDCSGTAGRTVAEARTFLQGLGFTNIEVVTQPSPTVPAGEVISCALSGSTATLTASSGPGSVIVPDVVGLRTAAGFAALTAAGLEAGGPQQVPNERPRGEIVATQPAAGASVAPGAVVTVIISEGPSGSVAVPPLMGLTQAAAAAAVSDAGLVPAFTTRAVPKGSPDIGLVVAVSPAAGSQLTAGSTVTVTIAVAETG